MVRRRNPPGQPDPRGGRRDGAPATAYKNRSDLTAAPSAPAAPRPTQPVTVAPNQAYGVAGAQAASQAAVPLPTQVPPAPGAAHAAAANFAPPDLGAFDRPTDRPDEPLTQGAPVGPGAGPEVMPGGSGGQPSGMSALLRSIAGAVGSSDLEALAARAESLGH